MTTFPDTKLVGMHFRGAHAVEYVAALQSGDRLPIEREPDNPYDQNAIKVLSASGDIHIAYVNADAAAWISPILDDNPEAPAFAVIERLEQYKNNNYPYATIYIGEEPSE